MARQNTDAFSPLAQPVELVEDPNASPGEGSEGGAGHAEFRERPQAKYQAGIKNQVEDVRNPQQTHGDRRIPGAAEDGIVQKEQQNHARAAQSNPGIVRGAG